MGELTDVLIECHIIADIRKRINCRSMVYQAELKERVALHNSLPFNTYFLLPYPEWEPIMDEYLKGIL